MSANRLTPAQLNTVVFITMALSLKPNNGYGESSPVDSRGNKITQLCTLYNVLINREYHNKFHL